MVLVCGLDTLKHREFIVLAQEMSANITVFTQQMMAGHIQYV